MNLIIVERGMLFSHSWHSFSAIFYVRLWTQMPQGVKTNSLDQQRYLTDECVCLDVKCKTTLLIMTVEV